MGLRDEAAVITEPFTQWVIEEDFADATPDWQSAGVNLVPDIRPFETTKLRLLNASHSAIAYTGLLSGQDTVANVVRDPLLGSFIQRLMRRELICALPEPPGLDLTLYGDRVLQRFANPCLHHRCTQIAMDGTEKIPQRWLQTLEGQSGESLLLSALTCWIYFILGTGLHIDDPRVNELELLRNSTCSLRERIAQLLKCLRIDPGQDPAWEHRLTLLQLPTSRVRAILKE